MNFPELEILPVTEITFKKPREGDYKPIVTAECKVIELSLLPCFIEGQLQACAKEISTHDLEAVDFEHAVELYDLNVLNGFNLYKAFQSMLRERRFYKNRHRKLTIMQEFLSGVLKASSAMKALINLRNQKYAPRIRPGLFKEDDIK